MSSDTGIYVIETKRDNTTEYRVAYSQNIDCIYGKFNDETYHWNGDIKMIRTVFKDAPVFDDFVDALDFAENLATKYEYLEYGVCVIKDFRDLEY